MSSMHVHATKLARAIIRASEEHGTPNTFSFAELHAFYGGPPPMIAGRIARRRGFRWRLAGGRVDVECQVPSAVRAAAFAGGAK